MWRQGGNDIAVQSLFWTKAVEKDFLMEMNKVA